VALFAPSITWTFFIGNVLRKTIIRYLVPTILGALLATIGFRRVEDRGAGPAVIEQLREPAPQPNGATSPH